MVDRSRKNLGDSAAYYLVWGWAVLAACLLEFIAIEFLNTSWHWLVWPVLMPAAAIVAFTKGRKHSKKGYRTFIDSGMKSVWAGFGLFMLIILTLSATTIGWVNGYMLVIALIGLGTFVSGGILKFKALRWGGVGSFILAVLPVLFPEQLANMQSMLVLLALSVLIAYLIPGYQLKSKA